MLYNLAQAMLPIMMDNVGILLLPPSVPPLLPPCLSLSLFLPSFLPPSLSSFLPPFLLSPPSHTKCTLCHGVIAIRNSHAAHPNWNDNSTDHLVTHGHPGLPWFTADQPAGPGLHPPRLDSQRSLHTACDPSSAESNMK